MVRDPGNRADQKANDIYRETRRQSQQRLNHPRIVAICSGVFQVDVENEQVIAKAMTQSLNDSTLLLGITRHFSHR